MKKLMGLVVAVFLIAAACSDSDDGGGISIASGDGGGGGDWCDFARQVEQASDDLDFETATPEELESQLNRFTDLLDEAKSRAPGEIQDAVNTTADAFGTFADAFADANYNILDADLAVFEALDTAELDEADRIIDTYNEEQCGIASDSAPADDAPADDGGDDAPADDGDADLPTEGTIRDELVSTFVAIGFTQQEAECLANDISLEELTNAEDPEQLFSIFEQCGIPLSRLAELGGG